MEIVFTKQAIKDFEKIKQNPTLHKKVIALLELIDIYNIIIFSFYYFISYTLFYFIPYIIFSYICIYN